MCDSKKYKFIKEQEVKGTSSKLEGIKVSVLLDTYSKYFVLNYKMNSKQDLIDRR